MGASNTPNLPALRVGERWLGMIYTRELRVTGDGDICSLQGP